MSCIFSPPCPVSTGCTVVLGGDLMEPHRHRTTHTLSEEECGYLPAMGLGRMARVDTQGLEPGTRMAAQAGVTHDCAGRGHA